MKYLISYGLLITTLFPMVSHSQITSRESNILSTPITWQAIQKRTLSNKMLITHVGQPLWQPS